MLKVFILCLIKDVNSKSEVMNKNVWIFIFFFNVVFDVLFLGLELLGV